MAILFMILRKMINNRWLVGSLLLGIIIAISLVSSIPAFTSGVLQRVLTKDLEEYQKRVDKFPGGLLISIDFNKTEESNLSLVQTFESFVQQEVKDRLKIPVLADAEVLQTIPMEMHVKDRQEHGTKPSADITSFSKLEEHIRLIDGRLPAKQLVDGIYEALVTETALKKWNMVLNTVYVLKDGQKEIFLKPVGVFQEKEGKDPYWFTAANQYVSSFFISDELFRQSLVKENKLLSSAELHTAFNYHQIMVNDREKILAVEHQLQDEAVALGLEKSEYSFRFPVTSILVKYDEKKAQFEKVLWSLYVPVFVMLALYLIMVASLIIDRQRTEIAILISRGASQKQIFLIYFMEVIMLGGVAFLIGPFVGMLLSRIIGVSNGFLEFVNRTGLPVQMSSDLFLYALWTVLACIGVLLVPVFLATKQNIISHKQAIARIIGQAVWHKFFLDLLLLLIAAYGWYSYHKRAAEIKALKEAANQLQIDALLFFIPVLFILGMGLFCLRLYPWLIRFIFWIGHRFWSPAMYTTLIQVGRASRQYQFMMIFIVMTVAVGLYSASMARTINQNVEEQLRYQNGADIRLQVEWNDDQEAALIYRGAKSGGEGEATPDQLKKPPVQYEEPSFEPFAMLPGVEHAAKVFVKDIAQVARNKDTVTDVKIMAIDPKEFGLTAWFKPSLLPHHWYQYLNLLAKEPKAILISRSLADKLKVKAGQTLTLSWNEARPADFTVYAIIDYWPSWNPNTVVDQYGKEQEQYLVVANLPQVQDRMRLEPYEVWLKMNDGFSSEKLYQTLQEQKIPVTDLNNVSQDLIQTKNSAFYLGLNGSLTLGFLLSMMITFTGYLIYWVITLGARKLQYGVLRAMGLSFPQLTLIIATEQMLTFGVAFMLGIGVGKVCNMLFLPSLGIYVGGQNQVPPFEITSRFADELLIYGFIGITLLIGLFILGMLLSRLSIHQAIKLGED